MPRKLHCINFFSIISGFGVLSKTMSLRMWNNWVFRISELRTCCFRREH